MSSDEVSESDGVYDSSDEEVFELEGSSSDDQSAPEAESRPQIVNGAGDSVGRVGIIVDIFMATICMVMKSNMYITMCFISIYEHVVQFQGLL